MIELLTILEVATILRVNEATVRRWIRSGILVAVALPRRGYRQSHRIPRSALEKVLANDK